MSKFHQFLTELSAHHTSIFWFQDYNFSKCQRIFTSFGTCIDIIDICFGIANGQICQFLTELSADNMAGVGVWGWRILSFHVFI